MNLDSLDGNTLAIAGAIAALLLAEMRLLRREMKIVLAALFERNRRRDARARRESSGPQLRRRSDAVPENFAEEEDTDIHVLMDLERENQRTRRKTDRQFRRPGDRPPRPGTHHD